MSHQFTLLELNKSIQEKINLNFPEKVWVIGEISELKINRNGHCYLELIEKDEVTDHIIARSRATIWAFTFRMLKPYFESVTGREISSGIKILVQAKVEYHELYGFSLNISDIDPKYTLGDLAQKKQEIIRKLEEDGVINLNKELSFPTVPQKIAIISSETAAGYQDFINQLNDNTLSYKFYIKLFPSIMQGQQAEESIIKSLDQIFNYEDFFDVVVIIRGGGSQADLSCFDSYLLAANIAQFPIPVLTGIGHDKDESVADMVSFMKLKTPTAVAEFIIDKTMQFEETILSLKDEIVDHYQDYIQLQKNKIDQLTSITVPSVKNSLSKHRHQLELKIEKLKSNTHFFTRQKNAYLNELKKHLPLHLNHLFIRNKEHIQSIKKNLNVNASFLIKKENISLLNAESKLNLLDPVNILKRGYSITYHNGKVLKDVRKVNIDEEIKIKLFKGSIRSKVIEKGTRKK